MNLFGRREEIAPDPETPAPEPSQDEADTMLAEAMERLESARSEYDSLVSDIMRMKKEINNQRETRRILEIQNSDIQARIQDGRKILKTSHKDMELAERAAAEMMRIKSEIESSKQEHRRLADKVQSEQNRLAAVKLELQNTSKIHETQDKLQKRVDELKAQLASAPSPADIASYKSKLDTAVAENRTLRARLEASTRLISELRQNASVTAPEPSRRGVVEAASNLVSQYKARLAETQQELERTRQELARRDGSHSGK